MFYLLQISIGIKFAILINIRKTLINLVQDVGHLTSDADEGEDKMERAALKEGKRAEDIANHYLSVFKQDLVKINIIEPSIWCKATEHIKEQIALVEKLIKKGYTYETEDGIYFDAGTGSGNGVEICVSDKTGKKIIKKLKWLLQK